MSAVCSSFSVTLLAVTPIPKMSSLSCNHRNCIWDVPSTGNVFFLQGEECDWVWLWWCCWHGNWRLLPPSRLGQSHPVLQDM